MAGERSVALYSVDTNWSDEDQNVDALLSGQKWDTSFSNVITYSFIDSASDLNYDAGVSFSSEFSPKQKEGVRRALNEIEKVADVEFEEIGDDRGENNANGTLRFANYDGLGAAFGFYPNAAESGGDMAFADGTFETAPLGSYVFLTFMHEIGHAMGLKHAHEDSPGPGFRAVGPLDDNRDSMEYSVMTYHSFVGQSENLGFYTNAPGHYAQTLMMYDIAALQRKYGPNWDHNGGNTVYTFDPATGQTFYNGIGQGVPQDRVIFRTEWDGGGIDTYDLSNFTTDLMIDLRPGAYSDFDVGGNALRARLNDGWGADGSWAGSSAREYAKGHVYNAMRYEDSDRSLIERAFGGIGDDLIRGNHVANVLRGNAGQDTLTGAAGDDRLFGGDHNDTLEGNSGQDRLYGDRGDDRMDGGSDSDRLFGGPGEDRLDGGDGDDFMKGQNGVDVVRGGPGDDTLQGNNGDDTVTGQQGDDLIKGGNNWDLVRGGAGDDTVDGQRGNDRVEGNAGNDRVLGKSGHDTLVGGTGDDRLLGDDGRDFLNGEDGADTLDGGTGRDTLMGGEGDDLLTGGAGPDLFRFRGDGPTGDDTVTDFENGTDLIKFDTGVGFDDLTIEQVGGDTVISWTGGSVRLEGETGVIDADDFLF